MKQRLMRWLVCPLDKTPLDLRVWESDGEIVSGVLINPARKIYYPIHGGVPRMLTYPTGVAREFQRLNGDRISRELGGLRLVDEAPPEGEETVLRSFSTEWVNYDWNPRTYWSVDADRMFKSMRFMLDLERHPVTGKVVLEVGIGIGGMADAIARTEACQLIGVDLGYAVDAAYRNFGHNPSFHIVQASIFHPPFREQTFDLVYSQGVIHHTPSTKRAFDQISRLPKKGGRLYIWVYSPTSEKRTALRRFLMNAENAVRPVIWRLRPPWQNLALLPIVPLYVIHQNFLMRQRRPDYIRYGWREAWHAARDRFTPRYAFRHSEDEVCGWFADAGYVHLKRGSQRDAPAYLPEFFLAATVVDGLRS